MGQHQRQSSKMVSRNPCPKDDCNSSDAFTEFDDGHYYCFSCGYHVPSFNNDEVDSIEDFLRGHVPSHTPTNQEENLYMSSPTLKGAMYGPIRERNISKETVKFYDVKLIANEDGVVTQHHYPYTDKDGNRIAYKTRTIPKDFTSTGPISKAVLFGQTVWPKGGKYITICEGEVDTLAVYQMLGSKWPVVGVTSATSAYKEVKRQYEWLDTYENIIICMDNDDPGKAAAREVASLFPKKAKIVPLHLKDAGVYLETNKAQDFVNHWWRAETYKPDDIINTADEMYNIIKQPRAKAAVMYPWDGLNKITYGMRLSEMALIISGTGSGKTSISREIAYHTLKTTPHNVGLMYLEETSWETGMGMAGLEMSLPVHLPDVDYKQDDLKQANQNLWGKGQLHTLSDSWTDNSLDYIADKIKYMAKGLDCKIIVLDHISFMVSDQAGDERKMLDEIAHTLKFLAVDLDIHLCAVAHTKRVSGKPLEEGGRVTLADIRGTAGLGQLSNIVLGLERDGQADDEVERNTTLIRVVKNRFSGKTGPATFVYYNELTGRLTEVDKSANMKDEKE